MKSILIIFLFVFSNLHYAQETPKEQKIQEELSNITLPVLPTEDATSVAAAKNNEIPRELDIDSTEVIKQEKTLPNEGDTYFTFSGGLAPFQASIGILKYFIPEWWGQLDINLTFLPSITGQYYYTASAFYKPYVAFRIVTGYSFYAYRIFEISLIAQIQFVFAGTDDIPILPSLGMRFVFDFFYIDIGVSYAVPIGSVKETVFKGWYPAITIGFRF